MDSVKVYVSPTASSPSVVNMSSVPCRMGSQYRNTPDTPTSASSSPYAEAEEEKVNMFCSPPRKKSSLSSFHAKVAGAPVPPRFTFITCTTKLTSLLSAENFASMEAGRKSTTSLGLEGCSALGADPEAKVSSEISAASVDRRS